MSQANNVKAMAGRDAIRLRVGDWRVIMEDGIVLDVSTLVQEAAFTFEEICLNEMVTIPRVEYLRLLAVAEHMSNLTAYDRAKTALAAGDDEMVPSPFADRLLDGECPLRVYRELRGLTQTSLADLSGVNRVQIADIEAGRRSGSVATGRSSRSDGGRPDWVSL